MIFLPNKPEVRTWKQHARKRLLQAERLGYALTLANHFCARGIYCHDQALAFGTSTISGQWYNEQGRQAFKRYDRVTRFIYDNFSI